MPDRKPIADGLFTWPSPEPRLIGGRNRTTGDIVFPCPSGEDGGEFEPIELQPRGELWSWTIQRFRPKPPYAGDDTDETFVPYAVGYVELPGEVIVESRLSENDPDKLKIGMPMELEIVPFRKTPDGDEIVTYSFRPVAP